MTDSWRNCRSDASGVETNTDLPLAVRHGEGDGHGRPFAATGWRFLAVPEDDDLGAAKRGRQMKWIKKISR